METIEAAIRDRRSTRAFLHEPIPDATIREVLDIARWSPSWANTQCWNVFVVRGATLDRIRAGYRARAAAKQGPQWDLPPHKPDWPAHMKARTHDLHEARQAANQATQTPPPTWDEFFGAPCLVVFGIDERLQPEYACLDVGLLVQTFSLAAHDKGLGTCMMAMAVAYPEILREFIPEARGKRLVVGVALGVPDAQAPVNRFARDRAELDEFVTWAR